MADCIGAERITPLCAALLTEMALSAVEIKTLLLHSLNVILERHPELRRLSPAEKLALVAELWDDLSTHPENVPVSAEHLAELDRRMAEYRRDPSRVTSWEAITARILGPAATQ